MKKFGQLHHTLCSAQLGIKVQIQHEGKPETHLAIFCDRVDPDNMTLKVLHGEKENSLLNLTTDSRDYTLPLLTFSHVEEHRILSFCTIDVVVKLTYEGVAVDVYEVAEPEKGPIESAYLFDDELFS